LDPLHSLLITQAKTLLDVKSAKRQAH